jgi:phosphopentomutase
MEQKMARAFLFVLDSFGIGGAPDALAYGDAGSDTLGHIAAACAAGKADIAGLRHGPLRLPNLTQLGLCEAALLADGRAPAGLARAAEITGLWGAATEVSKGKDTPSGHWEIAGVPVQFDWGYFRDAQNTFPVEFLRDIILRSGIPGILGNCHASGTDIIVRLGGEHIRTGRPIFYSSADSVIQIAAHEEHFGLERLYALCRTAFDRALPYRIGRVIARPFSGSSKENFQRTGNRKDFSVDPPEPTLLERAKDAGRNVIAVGKVADIFAHKGVTDERKANGNDALFDATLAAMDAAGAGDLVFTNFVDFDMLYGHRRDVPGYAAALEHFDRRLPELTGKLREKDLMILTADHGCDPTWRGTEHTRERVPILACGPGIGPGSIGIRPSFSDIGESAAAHLGIAPGPHGESFLPHA